MRNLILTAFCIAALLGCKSRTAELSFSPASLEDCGTSNSPSAVTIHWDATKANAKRGVKIWVSSKKKTGRAGIFEGDPGKLWLRGRVTGTKTTGAWVQPGTTFIVTDAKSGDTLASVEVPSAPCK
jgi:hypothetical protein